MPLFVDTTHEVVVDNLVDQDGAAVTGATVKATLYKSDGTTKLSGITQPVSLADQGEGKYVGVVDDGLKVSEGDVVSIKYVATKNGRKRTWWRDELVKKSRS